MPRSVGGFIAGAAASEQGGSRFKFSKSFPLARLDLMAVAAKVGLGGAVDELIPPFMESEG